MRANAHTLDITPTRQMDQGSGPRAHNVAVRAYPPEPLEANVLALWPDKSGDPVLMVTLDLLYPGPLLRHAIEVAAYPLPPERIIVASSHTHRAPMTDPTKPALGRVDEEYITGLAEKLSGYVRRSLDQERSIPVTLHVGETNASHSVNRRRRQRLRLTMRPAWNVIAMAPDPRGPVDETVILATLRDDRHKPLAHLWNYACHPVSHPDNHSYSSHYIHHVRQELRAQQGSQNLPVLFFQGFSGDTRPSASIGFHGLKGLLKRVLNGPSFRKSMKNHVYQNWASTLALRVKSVLEVQTQILSEPFTAKRLLRSAEKYAVGLTTGVKFQLVRLARDFAIVGVSGELVAEYATKVRALTTARYTICAGCIDDTFGYIPTEKMIKEGGYESHEYCRPFGLESVAQGVEAEMSASFTSLLTEPSPSGYVPQESTNSSNPTRS